MTAVTGAGDGCHDICDITSAVYFGTRLLGFDGPSVGTSIVSTCARPHQ
jgi:hypothetical protein